MSKIGIIGGGLAGLAAAYRLTVIRKNPIIHIFEANQSLGGRVFTKNFNLGEEIYNFDIGMNLIDFQSRQIQELIMQRNLDEVNKRLIEFKKQFLLFENGSIRGGDYYKPRFYFQGGNNTLLNIYEKQLSERQVQIFKSSTVTKICRSETENNKFSISHSHQNQHKTQSFYDEIYVSIPVDKVPSILDPDIALSIPGLKNHIQQTSYTQQISVAFLTTPNMLSFSGMLFINHPSITFICSHQEKYNQNCIVIQTTENFTAQNMAVEEIPISQKLYEEIPEKIREWILPEHIFVKKWETSLIRINKEYRPEIELLKSVCGKVQIIGESLYGKSRGSNAIASGLLLQ